ncbi:betaine-aldehyde dehydrogenase [Marinivivus vitaminiproducens]|uniref:betaine-aldehyde dehydrogenase n=1 Tax=Marinivivus vitaminiproducens TaxID=3035935 RepID=UPI0027A0DA07|nr:betaine-aldehyde dehydrogenase [Geminicoccaceae bacterium SCSIO 64248]
MKLPEGRAYIGGRFVPAASSERFPTVNPATGDILCEVELSLGTEVDRAVEAASAGFAVWSAMTGTERARVLMEAVRILRARNRELAELEVMDTGKPIQEAVAVDVHSGADAIEYFAGLAPTIGGSHIDLGASFAYTRREPLGVCAGIGAWNYPLQIACWKSAPALAAGNAMIFKPAELTPLTALRLAEIYTEAGLPDGVFNVVQGDARTGALLTAHPGIAKVSLTGEVGTGKTVMAAAASTLKHVTMELGGKSPLIVFDDAKLGNAVTGAMLGNFYTQGEICSNGTRVFVQRGVYDAFLVELVARTRRLVIGDPMDEATQVGALISAEHRDRVQGFIDRAIAAGHRPAVGGALPAEPALSRGFFVAPTVFAGVTDTDEIVREEIFGPVMAVLPFDDEEEVLARANGTPYGLAAGVFTTDLGRAHRMAKGLEAGICWINTYNVTPVEIPFGGVKQSGLGRENGLAAIEHYTQLKSVFVEMGDLESPY